MISSSQLSAERCLGVTNTSDTELLIVMRLMLETLIGSVFEFLQVVRLEEDALPLFILLLCLLQFLLVLWRISAILFYFSVLLVVILRHSVEVLSGSGHLAILIQP